MQRIIKNNKYPTVFKEHLLLSIFKSNYKDKFIIENINNLTFILNIPKLNSNIIKKILKEIFKSYKNILFKIHSIILENNYIYYKKYQVLLLIDLKKTKWIVPIYITSNLNLLGYDELYYLPKLKKRIVLKTLYKEEVLAKMFYELLNNDKTNLSNYYNLYNTKKDEEKYLSNIMRIYNYTKEKINIDVKINRKEIKKIINETITKLKERMT